MGRTEIYAKLNGVGGEATIAAMDDNARMAIGRKTLRFVQEVMKDPVLREKIEARAEELRAMGI